MTCCELLLRLPRSTGYITVNVYNTSLLLHQVNIVLSCLSLQTVSCLMDTAMRMEITVVIDVI